VTDSLGEKQSAALSSLVAAVGLTIFKIVVGVWTGSLGILAEAAHSGLDLVAAGLTFLAVRFSGRPADCTHLYGHGKIENLSALAETLLLLLTCVWIVWEAVHRLRSHAAQVQVTVWSLVVMLTSIAVDFSRSRMLARTAKKYHSQALEADALHFRTDVWSSAVVIAGLGAVRMGLWWGDAVAALGVSAVVVSVGMEQRIATAVSAVDGVRDCHHVRVRYSGPVPFIDLHVLVDGGQTLAEAHRLTETIEAVIQGIAPQADVTVHPEPF
jgi:cation diffusion facilitator family transporter